jgi:hypothetical protein
MKALCTRARARTDPDERRHRRAGTALSRGLHLPMVMTIKRLAASVAMVCLVANIASDPAWPRLAASPAVAGEPRPVDDGVVCSG